MLFADAIPSSPKRTCILLLPFGVHSFSLLHSVSTLSSCCRRGSFEAYGSRISWIIKDREPAWLPWQTVCQLFLLYMLQSPGPERSNSAATGRAQPDCPTSQSLRSGRVYHSNPSQVTHRRLLTPNALEFKRALDQDPQSFWHYPGDIVLNSNLSVESAHPTLPLVFRASVTSSYRSTTRS
ncbi:uncharacterized protein CC84DRAFT_580608 [Paraphaeosphaeria sporulosa]|uniref:Uncharacterized protein n=1 Tax=Paraphaeosphaeria sporulosa TaxID=1460663 RepID=A0A177CLS4_9PLEO|nr:uncharacterized protein CC84DRAFT_580608 [Paraphaeosphaeria sporulosa]OAG08504.1 hypothetical protein CC84DRAFT_580608 [Paraphaeosphaeria sporulosa]